MASESPPLGDGDRHRLLSDLEDAMRREFFPQSQSQNSSRPPAHPSPHSQPRTSPRLQVQPAPNSQAKSSLQSQSQHSSTAPGSRLYAGLPDHSSIRLLELLPGRWDDHLTATLAIHPLEGAPPYQCLSYSWGGSERPHSLHIGEATLPITASAYTALRRLRTPKKSRVLWVDAICINQDDAVEKSSQIKLMGQIYSSAARVLCWLGEDDSKQADIAIQLLKRIDGTDFGPLKSINVSPSFISSQGLPSRGDAQWFSLLHFFSCPWFRRSWCVQEFVRGSVVRFIWGATYIPWKKFVTGIEKVSEYALIEWGTYAMFDDDHSKYDAAWSGMMAFRMMIQAKNSSSWIDTYSDTVRSLAERDESSQFELRETVWENIVPNTRKLVQSLRDTPMEWRLPPKTLGTVLRNTFSMLGADDRMNAQLSLFNTLMIFQHSLATDPRDKLFALLGLSREHDEPALQADYTQSTSAVYMRYARYFISAADSSNPAELPTTVLLRAGLAQHSGLTLGLPSWVPDWSVSDGQLSRVLTLVGEVDHGYHAAGTTTPDMRLTDDTAVVLACGSKVGSITRLLPSPYVPSPADGTAFFVATRHFFRQVDALILHRPTPYPSGETPAEVLWRCLIGNVGCRPTLADPALGVAYAEVRALFDNVDIDDNTPIPADTDPQLGDWAQRWIVLMRFYDVVELSNGLVGLVPIGAEPGDLVVVLLGATMPFVLRHTPENERRFQLIGACYIHGIMQGEAVDAVGWNEELFCLV